MARVFNHAAVASIALATLFATSCRTGTSKPAEPASTAASAESQTPLDCSILTVYPGDFVHPDETWTLSRSTGEGVDPRRLVWAMRLDGDVFEAQVLTCPGCRRQMGWAVKFDVSKLAADERLAAEVQRALGWPASPVLRSADEWRTNPGGRPLRNPPCPFT